MTDSDLLKCNLGPKSLKWRSCLGRGLTNYTQRWYAILCYERL